jgi:aldehyde dehydrogenase (NAD+)
VYDFDPCGVVVRSGYFVDGQFHVGSDGQIAVARPSDTYQYGILAGCTADDVDRAVESAWRAFRQTDWASCSPRQRVRILHRWADLIDADAKTLAP